MENSLEKKFCGQCGSSNLKENKFCNNCGTKFPEQVELVQSEGPIIERSPAPGYAKLRLSLAELMKKSGTVSIIEEEGFIEFIKEVQGFKLQLNLGVRENFTAQQLQELRQIGFIPNNQFISQDLTITYQESTLEKAIELTEALFVNVFKIELERDFKIEQSFNQPIPKAFSKEDSSSTENKKTSGKALFFLIVIVVALIGYCSSSDEKKEEETTSTEIVQNSPWDSSVRQVEDYLKNNYLKDPDSYQGIDWSAVQKMESSNYYKFYVRHKFRAKNGFGGYVIENKVFYLDSLGTVVDTKDFGN